MRVKAEITDLFWKFGIKLYIAEMIRKHKRHASRDQFVCLTQCLMRQMVPANGL